MRKRMDLVTFAGLIIGIASVLIGMMLKHVEFSTLANPAAFFIIIVGTIGAVVIATPGNELKNVGTLFCILFGKPKHMPPTEAVRKMMNMARRTKKDGVLSLQPLLKSEKDPFLLHGIRLLVEGASSEKIYSSLGEDIAAMEKRHAAGAQIFTQAGTYAPTLGVLGAVLGLISALGDLGNIDALGNAISAAFMATLLGIFTGYVLWHPMANKLKRKSKQEVRVRTIVLEGIVGISEGTSLSILRDDLLSFIPARERACVLGGGE